MTTTGSGKAATTEEARGAVPSVMECWIEAQSEPWGEPRNARYRELLIQHGHLVPRMPGDPTTLPCGWPI